MKNQIVYGIILLILGLSSCDEWLDVSPKSEIKADKLYETEAGFRDALIGIYIGMTDRSAYGENLSWGALEFLAGQYQAPNGEFGEFQKYNYEHTSSKALIDAIWAKQYNLIAEVNFLLESLEQNAGKLNPTTFNIIKGEALGLRAMLHFDMLRLFGPLTSELDKESIPYQTNSDQTVTPLLSGSEVIGLILDDLKKFGTVTVDENMVIVCVVGDLEWKNIGFESNAMQAMKDIPVRMVSYGGSNYNISFLIKAEDKKRALQALSHNLFE